MHAHAPSPWDKIATWPLAVSMCLMLAGFLIAAVGRIVLLTMGGAPVYDVDVVVFIVGMLVFMAGLVRRLRERQ